MFRVPVELDYQHPVERASRTSPEVSLITGSEPAVCGCRLAAEGDERRLTLPDVLFAKNANVDADDAPGTSMACR